MENNKLKKEDTVGNEKNEIKIEVDEIEIYLKIGDFNKVKMEADQKAQSFASAFMTEWNFPDKDVGALLAWEKLKGSMHTYSTWQVLVIT